MIFTLLLLTEGLHYTYVLTQYESVVDLVGSVKFLQHLTLIVTCFV